ncbi:zeaxanthin epoxidase, putative [Medicago truncatula]|uniref:Zeaxanthin epoxidase, putative n=1 Tax=Medicago truncatula TaxID=3880 RepID=A0A072V8C0_MEDTR|nr:zeaxanthin epoxidase, putative [Medicago truncatula]
MFEQGICEAFKVNQAVLLSATEGAAEMILRVDDIITCAPRRREERIFEFLAVSADSLVVESLIELLDNESLRKDTTQPSPEWYIKFDTFTPAAERGLPVTRVISRMALQEILAHADGDDVNMNGCNVVDFIDHETKIYTVLVSRAATETFAHNWVECICEQKKANGSFPRPVGYLPRPYKAPYSRRESNDSVNDETSEGSVEEERKIMRDKSEGREE